MISTKEEFLSWYTTEKELRKSRIKKQLFKKNYEAAHKMVVGKAIGEQMPLIDSKTTQLIMMLARDMTKMYTTHL